MNNIKINDSFAAMNDLRTIKDLKEKFSRKLPKLVEAYEQHIKDGRDDYAIVVKNNLQDIYFDLQNDIINQKRKLFEEQMQLELYKKKLEFMINGFTSVQESFNDIFAKQGVCIRGYLVVSQHDSEKIINEFTTMRDFMEQSPISFTVFRENEIDLEKHPCLGAILYRIGANGLLTMIKENYDSRD